ncbi:MAG: hypothetical protein JWO31_2068 [Phycisphaerales bacterium]|nr:hypothetical protein [Phycisphaerales bacterium]
MSLGIPRLKRLALVAAVGGSLLAGLARPAAAKPGMVKAKTGQVFQGDVDEAAKPGFVIIKQPTGPVTINQANVDTITYFDTPKAEFDARMNNLGRQDVPGRVALARWALSQKELDLAGQAVASAKQIDPANAEVTALEKQVAAAQQAVAATRPAPSTVPATAAAGDPPRPPVLAAKRQVTPDEIQLVRQRELKANEKIRMLVPPDLKKKIVEAGLKTAAEARAMSQPDIGLLVIAQGTPEMRREVKISADPVGVMDYRSKVNRSIVSGCASAACHGGDKGGKLVLFAPAENEAAAITNFVVLQKFERKNDGVLRPMVDRTQPLNSLLLSYLLPPNQSPRAPHPDVQGYKGMVKSSTDPVFVAAQEWMGRTLSANTPNYDDIDLSQDPKPAPDKPAAGAGK